MDCALWLNRKKILTAADIPANLDIASLRGYFLAGSLIPWLEEHGGKQYAKRLAKISHDDPLINEKIAGIFGGKTESSAPYKILDGSTAEAYGFTDNMLSAIKAVSSLNIGSAGSYNYGSLTFFGSFNSFLQLLSAAGSGQIGISSYIAGFASSSSFMQSEWEWLWRLLESSTSFSASGGGSFTYGWEWLWNLIFGSSSSFATTSAGSFAYGWERLWNLIFGSASSFAATSAGSFAYGWEWLWNLLFGGSSSFGATSAGSFTYGWEWLQKLFGGFGSFNYGSFDLGSISAFDLENAEKGFFPMCLDEYDLVLLKTLADCPLDRFGYGIHNI